MEDANDKFPDLLGKTIMNLLSLETAMKFFLAGATATPRNDVPAGIDPLLLSVGDKVPADAVTNFDSLRRTIVKYNNAVPRREFHVDTGVADLRDAIAHGRILLKDGIFPPYIIKFSNADKNNNVEVMLMQRLDSDWLQGQVTRMLNEILKVTKAIEARG